MKIVQKQVRDSSEKGLKTGKAFEDDEEFNKQPDISTKEQRPGVNYN
jgi:hypothetical protein